MTFPSVWLYLGFTKALSTTQTGIVSGPVKAIPAIIMKDLLLTTLLAQRGLHAEAAAQVLRALQVAGLTRPGKQRIVESKVPQVDALIEERFFRVCTSAACRPAPAEAAQRAVLTVPKEFCEVCGGSASAHAVQRMAEAMKKAGLKRLLIVGGTPGNRQEILGLLPTWIDVQFVQEETSWNLSTAAQTARWADVIVIWGATPISHKVTELFKTYDRVQMARRGISSLAWEVTRHVEKRIASGKQT